MNDNNLTNYEKTKLVVVGDHAQKTNYDEVLYELLSQTTPPLPHEIDDRSRRAITKYIMETWPILKNEGEQWEHTIDETAMGAMTQVLIIGYELGRELRKPLLLGADKTK